MKLTKEELEEFIEEELDRNYTRKEVADDLLSVADSLSDCIDDLKELRKKTEDKFPETSKKIRFFYYQLLDKVQDLDTFIVNNFEEAKNEDN